MSGGTIVLLIVLAAAVVLVLQVRRNAARAPDHESPRDAIAEFWQWWARARDDITRRAQIGELQVARELIAPRIAAVHPSISCEIASRPKGGGELVFGWGGSLAARRRLRRLREIAPADADWQFTIGRRRSDCVAVGGVELDVARGSVIAHEVLGGAMLDVSVYHPDFPELRSDLRGVAADLLMVCAVGDDERERWVRGVDAMHEPSEASKPLTSIAHEIERRCSARGDLAVVMVRDEDVAPILVTVFTTIKPIDAIECDHHLELVCRLPTADSAGVDWLQDRESSLLERLGEHGVRVARELSGERRSVHFYVSVVGRDLVRRWSAETEQADSVIAIKVAADPEWEWYDDLLAAAERAGARSTQ